MKPLLDKDTETIDPHSLKLLDLLIHKTVEGLQQKSYKTQNSGTFNQGKSKECRLTYHRIGRLLSTMGFRGAKTPNGYYAILWDDQPLSQNTFPSDEKNEKQPSACPPHPPCPPRPALSNFH